MADRVVASCGCRIDLAGGTLDIWPLGLLFEGARTVNLAINVEVGVELARRSSGYVVRQGEVEHRADDPSELLGRPDAALFAVIAAELGLPPVAARLSSASPRGGGLGASSAIGVALVAAAERLEGRAPRRPLERALLVRDLEARLMRFPTGIQDQLPPQLGGVLEIVYRPGGDMVRRLEVDPDEVGRCLTIVYTGRGHVSGETNWKVIRRLLEGEQRTERLFSQICAVARSMVPALESGDLPGVGRLLAEEWSCRRQLAEGVSTPGIERILAAAAGAGAWGGKAGGAGGGGCVAVLHPAERRAEVRRAAVEAGGTVLEAGPRNEGLVVRVER